MSAWEVFSFSPPSRPHRTRLQLVCRSKPGSRLAVERSRPRGASDLAFAHPRAVGLGWPRCPLVACSFVLDTESLRKGGTGGAGGTTQTGNAGSAGMMVVDAAADGPTCTAPDNDPCSACLAMHCCAETRRCTSDPSCQLRLRGVSGLPARREIGVAHAACTMAYNNNGGMSAAGFVGCTLTNCSTVCG